MASLSNQRKYRKKYSFSRRFSRVAESLQLGQQDDADVAVLLSNTPLGVCSRILAKLTSLNPPNQTSIDFDAARNVPASTRSNHR